MNLNKLIEYYEIKLDIQKNLIGEKYEEYLTYLVEMGKITDEQKLEVMTPINLKVAECTLKELKGKKSLLGKLNDDMISEKKWCYRYGMWVVEQCDVCAECLTAEKLQWNEGDE